MAGSINALLAVAIGAFGAHALKKMVTPDLLVTFETGVRYQFYHSFALLITALVYDKLPIGSIRFAGYAFLTGIFLFSGSLYAITFLKIQGAVGLNGIGTITPIGGLFFIGGWIFLIAGILNSGKSSTKIDG